MTASARSVASARNLPAVTTDAALSRLATFVLVFCLAGLAGTTAIVVSPSIRHALGVGPQPDAPAYEIGGRVDVDPAIFATAEQTVILFARSSCAACRQGEGFFASVMAASHGAGRATVMVTPSPDAETEAVYARAVGLTASQVHYAASGSIKLRAVPAVMVVNRSGTIQHAWFGLPDGDTRTTILEVVSRTGGGQDS